VSIWLANKNKLSIPYKLLVQVVGPLVVVESCLWCKDYTPSSSNAYASDGNGNNNGLLSLLPLCWHWLLEFLELSKDGQDEYPQFYGLIYWIVLLILLAIPTMIIIQTRTRQEQQQQQEQQYQYSYAVRRKWFHLVAVLLFGPITHIFPDLMSLSYAIALCGLVVVETIRKDCPLLQSFYHEWIDPTKDIDIGEEGGILLSHMFLLLGCAMPLWMAQIACSTSTPLVLNDNEHNNSHSHSLLLAQWGVLCLGVGDAMAAVVGSSHWGKHRWGRNGRTLEGSLAMWTSMLVVGGSGIYIVAGGGVGVGVSPYISLFLATTLTTLLEAFTLQMDNLILPLAGSIVLLLLQPVSVS
jgi:dolichol kinase